MVAWSQLMAKQPESLPYLGSTSQCLLETECHHTTVDSYRRGKLTKDHIIPKVAGRDHPKVLLPLISAQENAVRLCRHHHDLVDRDKIFIYSRWKVIGLVNQIALYPRATEPLVLGIQLRQWMQLFTGIRTNLTNPNLNGGVETKTKEEYLRAADIADMHLYRWSKGDF